MSERAVLPRWIRRVRLLVTRAAVERSMDAEMRFHIECETAEHVRRGMPPEDARRQALRDFGGLAAVKDHARDARGLGAVEDLVLDLRHAARVLRRHLGVATAAVLTLGLGIGAATAIYSVVYGVLLRPLPYAHADDLVVIWERNVAKSRDRNVVSLDTLEAWRATARAFDGMAALMPRAVTLAGGDAPERIIGAEVSPGYFDLIGVAPSLGREFDVHDATPDGPSAVILSDRFWRRRFGGDASAVGRTLVVSGRALTIVGVMPAVEPPRFGWLDEQQIWLPFAASAENRAWGRFLLVVGRLRRGVTLEAARAEMNTIAENRAREVPANRGWGVTVVPLAQEMTGDIRTTLVVLFGAVGLLLAMAVVNVATLMLTLTRRRAHELALRRAIGASDARLFRQLFTQSSLLGLLGAAIGVLMAVPAVRLLRQLLPPEVPRVESIRLDWPVLAASAAAAAVATVAFGSAAAFRGRSSCATVAQEIGSTRVSAQRRDGMLVVVEIALTLALSVVAALTARSLVALHDVQLGFTSDGVLMLRAALPADGYATPASQRVFISSLLDDVRRVPGIDAAGIISIRPFGGSGPATTFSDPGHPIVDPAQQPVADVRYADAGVFAALRIPIVRGGLFDDRRALAGPPQAIVSQSLASMLWPDGDPIGRRLDIVLFGGITATIVGVCADVHLIDARTPVRPAIFLSALRFPDQQRDLVLRTELPPDVVLPALRGVAGRVEPALALYQITSMPTLVGRSLASDRFITGMLAAFAIAALGLAAVGIFGVVTGDVTGRRTEIGVRMALGGRAGALVSMFVRRAMIRAAAGVAIGAAIALGASRSMASLLFGVGADDPLSFAGVALLLFAVAATAAAIPAVQAVRRSPVASLQRDA